MENQELKNKAEEPFADYLPTGQVGGRYTYADYLTWQLDEMVELIKGKVFKHAAAPKVNHQRVSMKISNAIFSFLKGKKCEVFTAPFDVRLPVKSNKNNEIDTVHNCLGISGCIWQELHFG